MWTAAATRAMGAAVPAKRYRGEGGGERMLYTAALNPLGASARLGGSLFCGTTVVCHFLPLVGRSNEDATLMRMTSRQEGN